MCCSSWGHKELDMTEQLNSTEFKKPLGDSKEGRKTVKFKQKSKKCLKNSLFKGVLIES